MTGGVLLLAALPAYSARAGELELRLDPMFLSQAVSDADQADRDGVPPENLKLALSMGRLAAQGGYGLDDSPEVRFIVALTCGLLASPNADDFYVSGPHLTERVSGVASGTLIGTIGVSFDTVDINGDLEVGGGLFANGAFTAPLVVLTFTPRFNVGENITFGPHIGAMWLFGPTGEGDLPVSFSDTTGGLAGVVFTAGSPSISFSHWVDWLFGSEVVPRCPPSSPHRLSWTCRGSWSRRV